MVRRLLCVSITLLLTGCPEGPGAQKSAASRAAAAPLSVWADPALMGAVEALQPLLLKAYPAGWKVAYVERGELLKCAAAGSFAVTPAADKAARVARIAPDVLLFPDAGVFTALRKAKLIDEASARTFAGDVLVVANRRGDHWPALALTDLPPQRFRKLGIGSTDTAAGWYTQQALTSEGVMKTLAARLKPYSTADLAAALQRKEADIVVTYASTAAQDSQLEVSMAVKEELYEDIRYKALAAVGRTDVPGVLPLLRLLAEDSAAQQALGGYGYMDRAGALREQK